MQNVAICLKSGLTSVQALTFDPEQMHITDKTFTIPLVMLKCAYLQIMSHGPFVISTTCRGLLQKPITNMVNGFRGAWTAGLWVIDSGNNDVT